MPSRAGAPGSGSRARRPRTLVPGCWPKISPISCPACCAGWNASERRPVSAWFPRVTLHSLVVAISVLVYVLTTRVEHERRPPSIAIAWVLGMIAVPYLALPTYLLFGRRKLPRKVLLWSGIGSHCTHWAEDLIESFGLAPSAPSSIRLHQDGSESAAALFATMSNAIDRLDICTYILGNDAFGREAMQRMIDRARSGVQVRLLIEGVCAAAGGRPAAGAAVPAEVTPGVVTPDVATPGVAMPGIVMPGVVIPGVVIPGVATSVPQPAGARAQFLPSGPDQAEDTVHALLIDACFHVRERLLAVTPYFVPDVSLETAMRLAARRGVKIDLCIPVVSNHRLADFARNTAVRTLTAAGVIIHFLQHTNPAKAVQ